MTGLRVAVLGGGPAGGAAALRLARRGVRVTLYHPERRSEKPCGGALPAYLLDELEELDTSRLAAVAVGRAELENAAGCVVTLALGGLRIFRRGDLDPALVAAAGAAGAEIRAGRVRRLSWRGGRPVVGTDDGSEAFDWIVGADGARGLSRRSLGLDPGGESVGLGASIEGLGVDRLTLSFPDLADAYLWIFPRPGGCSVGIAYSADALSADVAEDGLDTFLGRHLGIRFAELGGARYRYPIPVYGPWVRGQLERAAAHRVLLVGDAASIADPLTREGIRYAVRSGIWAAEALASARPERYARRVAAGIDAELTRAAAARRLFFEASIGQWMIPVCRRHAGIRSVLEDLLRCDQPYTGLRRRLLAASLSLSPPQGRDAVAREAR